MKTLTEKDIQVFLRTVDYDFPVPLSKKVDLKAYAEKLHQALGCNSVSRVDLRWNEEDGVVLLEINTNPGMTALSLVPEQAKYAGVSYADLCAKLVEGAK